MNGNDLMNALSGLDPKFIDEAAYELHDVNAAADPETEAAEKTVTSENSGSSNVVDITSAKKARIRKFIYIALPSAAAILLIVGVAFPAIMHVSKSESAMPASESAAPAADASFAAEPESEAAAETAYDAEAVTESVEEAAPAAAEEASYNSNADMTAEAPSEEVGQAAQDIPAQDNKRTLNADTIKPAAPDSQAKSEEAVTAGETGDAPAMEEAAEETAPAATEEAESVADEEAVSEAEEAETAGGLVIENAKYQNGMLTLEISGMTADEISDMKCTIEQTMAGRSVVTYDAGTVSDLMTKQAPLTLDIKKLSLTPGTYKITVGNSSAEFSI